MDEAYQNLCESIGRVVVEWAHLEEGVSALVFDLSAIESPAFYEDAGVTRVAVIVNANIDLRTSISLAKALAHRVKEPADFFTRIKTALDEIGNDLRNERNRYVHDIWQLPVDRPIRINRGTKITRAKGSGELSVNLSDLTHYGSVAEVDLFADRIRVARIALLRLSSEAQAIFRKKYPGEE